MLICLERWVKFVKVAKSWTWLDASLICSYLRRLRILRYLSDFYTKSIYRISISNIFNNRSSSSAKIFVFVFLLFSVIDNEIIKLVLSGSFTGFRQFWHFVIYRRNLSFVTHMEKYGLQALEQFHYSYYLFIVTIILII